ncbi:MAG: 3'-5' exonuclease [Bacteroidia bacterium]|nr:3'-5' exonuclease [Bacteroidia bacterium]
MPFLVFDLEMSGTDPEYDEIIQIGAVAYTDEWTEAGTYLQLVCPEDPENLSVGAEKVHGLTKYDLEDAPMIYDVLPEMETWVRKQFRRRPDERLSDIVLCGQSVIYDINFLKFAYNRQNMDWPYSNKMIDLHTISYFMGLVMKANGKPTPKSLSLEAISGFFGFSRAGSDHDALEDAQLTARCLKAYFKMAAEAKLP